MVRTYPRNRWMLEISTWNKNWLLLSNNFKHEVNHCDNLLFLINSQKKWSFVAVGGDEIKWKDNSARWWWSSRADEWIWWFPTWKNPGSALCMQTTRLSKWHYNPKRFSYENFRTEIQLRNSVWIIQLTSYSLYENSQYE